MLISNKLQLGEGAASKSDAMADAGTSVGGGYEGQKSEHAPFPTAGLGLE